MTSGPVVALCLQRENAVGRLLEVLGPSDPRAAKRQSQFFLRGSFGEDCIQNGFYGTYIKLMRIYKYLQTSSEISESFPEISGDVRMIVGYLNPFRNCPGDFGQQNCINAFVCGFVSRDDKIVENDFW